MRERPFEQLAERGEGAGSDDLGFGRGDRFDAADDDLGWFGESHAAPGFAQECRLPGIRFDQRDVQIRPHRRHHQAGESTPAAQIGEGFRPFRDQDGELGRIQDVADPDTFYGGPADQVDSFLPADQRIDQSLELVACFT